MRGGILWREGKAGRGVVGSLLEGRGGRRERRSRSGVVVARREILVLVWDQVVEIRSQNHQSRHPRLLLLGFLLQNRQNHLQSHYLHHRFRFRLGHRHGHLFEGLRFASLVYHVLATLNQVNGSSKVQKHENLPLEKGLLFALGSTGVITVSGILAFEEAELDRSRSWSKELLPSPALMTRSGTESVLRCCHALDFGSSPYLVSAGSTFSTTVRGMGVPPGL